MGEVSDDFIVLGPAEDSGDFRPWKTSLESRDSTSASSSSSSASSASSFSSSASPPFSSSSSMGREATVLARIWRRRRQTSPCLLQPGEESGSPRKGERGGTQGEAGRGERQDERTEETTDEQWEMKGSEHRLLLLRGKLKGPSLDGLAPSRELHLKDFWTDEQCSHFLAFLPPNSVMLCNQDFKLQLLCASAAATNKVLALTRPPPSRPSSSLCADTEDVCSAVELLPDRESETAEERRERLCEEPKRGREGDEGENGAVGERRKKLQQLSPLFDEDAEDRQAFPKVKHSRPSSTTSPVLASTSSSSTSSSSSSSLQSVSATSCCRVSSSTPSSRCASMLAERDSSSGAAWNTQEEPRALHAGSSPQGGRRDRRTEVRPDRQEGERDSAVVVVDSGDESVPRPCNGDEEMVLPSSRCSSPLSSVSPSSSSSSLSSSVSAASPSSVSSLLAASASGVQRRLSASSSSPTRRPLSPSVSQRCSSSFLRSRRVLSPHFSLDRGSRSRGGLKNLGNTCYMNAVIRLLVAAHDHTLSLFFFAKFFGRPRSAEDPAASPPACASSEDLTLASKFFSRGPSLFPRRPLFNAYLTVAFRLLLGDSGAAVNPGYLKKCVDASLPLFVGNQQQDAHEFLCMLLEALDTEIGSYLSEKREELFRIFGKDREPLSLSSLPSTSALSRSDLPSKKVDGRAQGEEIEKAVFLETDRSRRDQTQSPEEAEAEKENEGNGNAPARERGDGCGGYAAPRMQATEQFPSQHTVAESREPAQDRASREPSSLFTERARDEEGTRRDERPREEGMPSPVAHLMRETLPKTPFAEYFEMTLKQIIRCTSCMHRRVRFETPRCLSLDITPPPSRSCFEGVERPGEPGSSGASPGNSFSSSSFLARLSASPPSPSASFDPSTASRASGLSSVGRLLMLPHPSLGDLLRAFFSSATVEYRCEEPGCGGQAVEKIYRVVAPPRLLLLHVKRFMTRSQLREYTGRLRGELRARETEHGCRLEAEEGTRREEDKTRRTAAFDRQDWRLAKVELKVHVPLRLTLRNFLADARTRVRKARAANERDAAEQSRDPEEADRDKRETTEKQTASARPPQEREEERGEEREEENERGERREETVRQRKGDGGEAKAGAKKRKHNWEGKTESSDRTIYRLKAFITHRGNSPDIGHYVCYSRDWSAGEKGCWTCWNDSESTKLGPGLPAEVHTEGYLLLYERESSPESSHIAWKKEVETLRKYERKL
ncbi:ubiquitin carboxyl-terminal hydrolase [Toxoplasma gondii TgCatPRC2]|uniref:ubiquitinyl hydrolase 1 n=1 Tax=Toxoplasma gondii TgCatPRC2 TaxID=1130821 RepID=A0A151HLM5_TOXGO|nr:ubiquitin carboxyl-terminal hydrolase [Toxoplasma gondii TgCatPRC2]